MVMVAGKLAQLTAAFERRGVAHVRVTRAGRAICGFVTPLFLTRLRLGVIHTERSLP